MAKSGEITEGAIDALVGMVGALGVNWLSSNFPTTFTTGNTVFLTKAALGAVVIWGAPHAGKKMSRHLEAAGVGAITVALADFARAQLLAQGYTGFSGVGSVGAILRDPNRRPLLAGRIGVMMRPSQRVQPEGRSNVVSLSGLR